MEHLSALVEYNILIESKSICENSADPGVACSRRGTMALSVALRYPAACSPLPPPIRACRLPPRSHGRAMAVLEEARQLRLQYDLKRGQSRFFHRLPSGLGMEVIFQKGAGGVGGQEAPAYSGSGRKPPLVFVHGSFHAAWCWAEHWLPFFSEASYDCYAVSLLGQVSFRRLIQL